MTELKVVTIPIATRAENAYGFVGTNTFKENIKIDGFITKKIDDMDAFQIESDLPLEHLVDRVSEILYLLALSNPNYAHHEVFYGGITEHSSHPKEFKISISLNATSIRGKLDDIEAGLIKMRKHAKYEELKQAVYWFHQGTLAADRAGKFSSLYFAFETMMRLHETPEDIQSIWDLDDLKNKKETVLKEIESYLLNMGLKEQFKERVLNSIKNTKSASETDTYLKILNIHYKIYPSKKELNSLRALRGGVFHQGNRKKAEEGLGLLLRIITLVLDIEIYGSPKFLKTDKLLIPPVK